MSCEEFADRVAVGQVLVGRVTSVVPIGVFVRVEGVDGLVPTGDGDVDVGDEMTVIVADIDRSRRRLKLRAR